MEEVVLVGLSIPVITIQHVRVRVSQAQNCMFTVLLCCTVSTVSGIRVESRERVTFAPTPMKRFHDLQQFHLHWTR